MKYKLVIIIVYHRYNAKKSPLKIRLISFQNECERTITNVNCRSGNGLEQPILVTRADNLAKKQHRTCLNDCGEAACIP